MELGSLYVLLQGQKELHEVYISNRHDMGYFPYFRLGSQYKLPVQPFGHCQVRLVSSCHDLVCYRKMQSWMIRNSLIQITESFKIVYLSTPVLNLRRPMTQILGDYGESGTKNREPPSLF